MYERMFTLDDQNIFAKLSGDYNKLHTDEIAARRHIFGGLVVHGIHLVLWALNIWLEKIEKPVELISLSVSFKKPLYVGEKVNYRFIHEDDNYIKIELYGEEYIYVILKGNCKFVDINDVDNIELRDPSRKECRVLNSEDIIDVSGMVNLYIDKKTAGSLFPHLITKLPLIQIAQIIATTRVVGMECPGLYSIFGRLDVSFDRIIPEPSVLNFKVSEFILKFSLVKIEVKGPSMKGEIKAFLTPPPQKQKSFSEMCKMVTPDEFKDQHALIIGGSRGLGEVTSKLLAAGGARIILTYNQGYDDAQKIADEINSRGERAIIKSFNVLDLGKAQIDGFQMYSPTHLYYFATPHITGERGIFSEKLFNKFCDYYVSGFFNTINLFLTHISTIKKVFYPSSIFIDELPLPFCEYAASKAAGEVLCKFMEKDKKSISIYMPRLPKMATDQTVSIISINIDDPIPIMLEYLRKFKNYTN